MSKAFENLVLYGAQNLTSNKCRISKTSARDAPENLLDSIEMARKAGSVVVSQKSKAKPIKFAGVISVPDALKATMSLSALLDEYDRALNSKDRYLRIMRNYEQIHLCDAVTGWAVGGDGTNLTLDSNEYQYGSASLNFDISISTYAATITCSSMTAVDLGSVDETGAFGFWIYFPLANYVSQLRVRIGSSDANYWEQDSITVNYEGNTFTNGWNFIAVDWATMTETGTVVPSAIDYIQIQISFNSSQVSDTDFRFDGVLWMDETEVRNYRCYRVNFKKSDEHYDIDKLDTSLEFFAYEGVALDTFSSDVFEVTGVATNENLQECDFGGSFEPAPYVLVTVNDATGLGTIRVKNRDNDEYMDVTPASIGNGDTFVFDVLSQSMTHNGSDIDFGSIFPNFNLGINQVALELVGTSPTIEEQTTHNASTSSSSVDKRYAQSFQSPLDGFLTKVELYTYCEAYGVFHSGFPPYLQAFDLEIQTDSGGDPSGTALWSGSIGIAETSTYKDWWPQTLNVAITNGTTYWIVLTPYWTFRGAWAKVYDYYNTAGGYANGIAKYSNNAGGTWANLNDNDDWAFKATCEQTPAWDVDWELSYKKRHLN